MEKKRSFRLRLCDLSGGVVAALTAAAFAFFSLISLLQTCHVDIGFSPDNSEHVSFLSDNVPLNLVILVVLALLTLLLLRAKITRRTAALTLGGVMLVTAAIGVWWCVSSKAAPAADSQKIVEGAQSLLRGDYDAVRGGTYFYVFPFQLGYLLYAQTFLSLFGATNVLALQLINVVFVELAYLATYLIARRLFQDARIWLLSALYLGLCLQPMLLSTFAYGTLPGLALALWATYFVIVCMQSGKLWTLLPAALLIALAVTLKKNFLIVLIANVIMLLVYALRNKKALVPLGAAIMAALSLLAPAVVQKGYENELDVSFGKGTPQSAWLVTGFTESSFCSGWFNGITTTVMMENDFDYERADAQCKENLIEQLSMFAGRPRYLASFLFHKVVSQWNEPAYQSIWSSASSMRTGEVSPLIESLGTGAASDAVNACLNQLMQYVYVGFTGALLLLLRRKNRTDERMILPLIVLGAVIYHALFEAKAQYAIIYVPMLLPYAAYAAVSLGDWVFARLGRIKQGDKA